ncbi:MAG: virulence RhuM family protein [Desulfobulbaceae bacterium]|nr:virulence RhuM family protein [Desulfobulbaceae bacterium]
MAKTGSCCKKRNNCRRHKTYQIDYYNLDAIISVGYRINSRRDQRNRACSNWAGCLILWSKPQATIERVSLSALSAGVKAYG